MEEENKNAYSEVIAVLKLLDDEEKLEAVPMEMLELLKSKANPEYQPEYSKDIPLDEQNLMPETLSILSWIAMKYWGEEVENSENGEKQSVEEKQEENIEQTVEEKQEENKEQNIEENTEQPKEESSTLPISYNDLKWYQKLRIKIIEFFNRIFKRKNNENN